MTTDPVSLITGKTLDKIGINDTEEDGYALGVTVNVVDNKPHLNWFGTKDLCNKFMKVVIATTNESYEDNIHDNLENLESDIIRAR